MAAKATHHSSGCLCLHGEADEVVAFNAGRGALRFFTQAFCPFSKTLIEWDMLSEIAALLHGAAPFRERKAEAQAAVSSPMNARRTVR
jgi:hypothetical protein